MTIYQTRETMINFEPKSNCE